MMFKKSFSVIFSIIAICFFSELTVYADDSLTVKEAVTEQVLSWCETIEPDVEIEVKDIIPIVDTEGDIFAYSASVWSGDTPYGYVNVDFSLDFPVYDYCVSKENFGLYESIVNNCGFSDSSIVSPIMISINDLQYYVLDNNKILYNDCGDRIDDTSGFNIDSIMTASTQYEHEMAIMYTLVNKNLYDIIKIKDLKNVTLYSEDYVEKKTGKYACAVSALTSIAYCSHAGMSSFKSTYDAIWKYTHTFNDHKENGIQIGETLYVFLASGMKSYIESVGKNCGVWSEKNPKSSFFRTAIDVEHPCVLCYWINIKEKGKVGHSVFVNGYVVTKEKSTGKTKYFLKIANGWSNKYHYINYTDVDLIKAYGVEFSIHN